MKYLLKAAQDAALTAGKAIMEIYRSGGLPVTIKEDESPLTSADKNSHTIITECLGKTNLPVLSEEGMNIGYEERRNWQYFWLVDPLDGTKEFVNRIDEFTVNIALMHQDKALGGVVYIPCTGQLFYGSKETGVFKIHNGVSSCIPPLTERITYDDIRRKKPVIIVASRSHLSVETKEFVDQFQNPTLVQAGSSLKFMLLLEGRADMYPRLSPTMEWDTAAAHAILNACNRAVYQANLKTELIYNKPDLANPFFIAF